MNDSTGDILSKRHISQETNSGVLDIVLLMYIIIIEMFMIFTNSVLFHVICWTPQLRETPTYLQILSLVVSDLLYTTGVILTTILYFWPLDPTPLLCTSFLILIYCPSVSSALNFMFCLGEQYMKICHPFWYANKISSRNAIISVTVPWMMTMIISVVTVIEALPGELYNGICPVYLNAGLIGLIIFICVATICLVVMLFFMYGISKVSMKQRNQVWTTSATRENNTIHKRIAFLLLFSFIFYVPMYFVNIIDSMTSLYRTNASFRLWYQIAMELCMLHFALHSLVYGWNEKTLRHHIMKLFTRMFKQNSDE